MARYRKIDPRVWNDAKFLQLSDDGKFVFLFILTHPSMTALGAMRARLDGLASELGWRTKRMQRAAREVEALRLLVINERVAFVGASNFLRYNQPEGPNSVKKAWVAALDLIPECEEKNELVSRCRRYLDGMSDDFKRGIGEAIWETFSKPPGILEPELEKQEQEPQPDPDTRYQQSRSKVLLPPDFILTEEMKRAIVGQGCADPVAAFGHFRNYHLANNSAFADWSAAWRTWTGNHRRFGCPCQPGSGRRSRSGPNVSTATCNDTEKWNAELVRDAFGTEGEDADE